MGKKRKGLILAAAVYLLLLVVLLAGERGNPEASIRTFGDAVWYSLVTMTTVGYGDLYPVTPLGRAVSLVFLAASVGLLAALAAVLFSRFQERILPRLRLSAIRRRPFYLFCGENEASRALAARLTEQEPGVRILKAGVREPGSVPRAGELPGDWVSLIRDPQNPLRPRGVFLMSGDEGRNLALAAELSGRGFPVYCMAAETGGLPGVRYFEPQECRARQYWRRCPIRPEERVLLLTGQGSLARALLDQAVLVNCRVPFCYSEYHLFGDWSEYLRDHPVLREQVLEKGTERFVFHPGPWTEDPALAGEADRIVLCDDDPAVNLADAGRLIRLFPFRGRVHGFGERMPAPAEAFGGIGEVFTPENVMRMEQDRAARALHGMYCRETGTDTAWEELSEFQKDSNRAAADHLRTKMGLLLSDREASETDPGDAEEALRRFHQADSETRERFRRCEHERWARFHWLYNWRPGPEKNAGRRTHPLLVPFEELSEEERRKDDYAWESLKIWTEGKS